MEDIEKTIRTLIKQCMDKTADFELNEIDIIDKNVNLKNIGMDSIMYVKLTVDLETTFDFELPIDSLVMDTSVTIHSLCEIVKNNI